MTNTVQTTLSINEDDLRRTSPTPLYPVGIIYEVVSDPSPAIPLSKYIYLRAQASGGDLASFQPYSVIGTGFEGSERRAVTPTQISAPGVNICVPQEIGTDTGKITSIILEDHYAFFLLSGRGKGKINQAGNAGNYYTVSAAAPTEFEFQAVAPAPTFEYRNETHMSIVADELTANVTANIVLFDKLGEVIA